MSSDWIYLSASQLAEGLRGGNIGSRDLLEAYLQRVEKYNPALNAVVAKDVEGARELADKADKAIGRGEVLGCLHGLPLTIKDTWEVPGMACTAGAPVFRNHHPKTVAPAVQRLQETGAIVFGKTNVPYFASDIQSYNRIYGTTNNPWNHRLTPGGSSGGAAAALAAGFTSLELGSDLAGSIRIPAHYCGVYGHKPSHGIIPLRGHIPGPPGTLGEPPLAVAGPMSRTAEDLELMLDILAGPPPEMTPGWKVTLPVSGKECLKDYRVLMWTEDLMCPVDEGMRRKYGELKSRLIDAGVQVDSGAPEGVDMAELYAAYMQQLGGVIGTVNPKRLRVMMYFLSLLLGRLEEYLRMPKQFSKFMAGTNISYAGWAGLDQTARRFRERFIRVFEDYDVILMPPTATTAILHQQEPDMPRRRVQINGKSISYMDLFIWISPATLFGLPATSAPIGVSDRKTPVNVQIVAGPYRDRTSIDFARYLADIMGGFQAPPGYSDV